MKLSIYSLVFVLAIPLSGHAGEAKECSAATLLILQKSTQKLLDTYISEEIKLTRLLYDKTVLDLPTLKRKHAQIGLEFSDKKISSNSEMLQFYKDHPECDKMINSK